MRQASRPNGNSKLQTPNFREPSIIKLQNPLTGASPWNLQFGSSLVLGPWRLELRSRFMLFASGGSALLEGIYSVAGLGGIGRIGVLEQNLIVIDEGAIPFFVFFVKPGGLEIAARLFA